MDDIPNFRKQIPLEDRINEYNTLHARHPNRIPIILSQNKKTLLPKLLKRKFLVPKSLTIGQFMFSVRKRMKLKPEIGVFMFVRNTIAPNTQDIGTVHEKYKSQDGFLYMIIAGENTFG